MWVKSLVHSEGKDETCVCCCSDNCLQNNKIGETCKSLKINTRSADKGNISILR